MSSAFYKTTHRLTFSTFLFIHDSQSVQSRRGWRSSRMGGRFISESGSARANRLRYKGSDSFWSLGHRGKHYRTRIFSPSDTHTHKWFHFYVMTCPTLFVPFFFLNQVLLFIQSARRSSFGGKIINGDGCAWRFVGITRSYFSACWCLLNSKIFIDVSFLCVWQEPVLMRRSWRVHPRQNNKRQTLRDERDERDGPVLVRTVGQSDECRRRCASYVLCVRIDGPHNLMTRQLTNVQGDARQLRPFSYSRAIWPTTVCLRAVD